MAQLLKSDTGSTRDYDVSESVDCEDDQLHVEGKIRLTRTSRGVLVTGNLRTETEVKCSRCLRRFCCPLDLNIEEEFFPTIDVNSGNPVAVPDEPGAFTIDKHHILDLDEAVCQYSLMAIPMKPLCRQECEGLCPKCGKDLNEGPCGCPPRDIDPRLARIRDAFRELLRNPPAND